MKIDSPVALPRIKKNFDVGAWKAEPFQHLLADVLAGPPGSNRKLSGMTAKVG
jgi:hypothetical protein